MTRIFDALKKAQAVRTPVPAPATPSIVPVPPASRAPAPRAGVERGSEPDLRRAIVPVGWALDLPADVEREMATLRVSLELGLPERTTRTVMFVSSQGGEGTSAVVAQFAHALARDGRLRVLVVDTHVARPAWSGPGGPALGAPRERARASAPRHLDLLPLAVTRAGQGLPQPLVRQTVQDVATAYDWILLDGPPVLESPDAAPLAAVADGVVVVVRAGRTKRPVLSRAVDLLRRSGARVLGTVLNRRRLEIPGFIYRRI